MLNIFENLSKQNFIYKKEIHAIELKNELHKLQYPKGELINIIKKLVEHDFLIIKGRVKDFEDDRMRFKLSKKYSNKQIGVDGIYELNSNKDLLLRERSPSILQFNEKLIRDHERKRYFLKFLAGIEKQKYLEFLFEVEEHRKIRDIIQLKSSSQLIYETYIKSKIIFINSKKYYNKIEKEYKTADSYTCKFSLNYHQQQKN